MGEITQDGHNQVSKQRSLQENPPKWGFCFVREWMDERFSFSNMSWFWAMVSVTHTQWGKKMALACQHWDCLCSQRRLVELCGSSSQIPILPGVMPQEGWLSFLSLRQSEGHRLLWWLVCLSVRAGRWRVKPDSLSFSVYSFVGPLSSCQPSQWDSCPLYNNLPTFRVAAFTVPILLWTSITAGFWMQGFMISGYKQYAQ